MSQDTSHENNNDANNSDKEEATIDEDIDIATKIGTKFGKVYEYKWVNGVLAFKIDYHDSPSWIPFRYLRHDAPVQCAEYIIEKMDKDPRFTLRDKQWAQKTMEHIEINCRCANIIYSQLATEEKKPRIKGIKYTVEVPLRVEDSILLDELRDDTLWEDATYKEVTSLLKHKVFLTVNSVPRGYKFIKLNCIYDVKVDRRRKARVVALGNTTSLDGLFVSSTTVDSLSVNLLFLIAQANKFDILIGDIETAYILADTNEKLYTVLGKEFGDMAGKIAIVTKALYGLRTSGLMWHKKFAKTLKQLGWVPTPFDDDVYMRTYKGIYSFIAVHVDDFSVFSRHARELYNEIALIYKCKGGNEPTYYLGNDFRRDQDGRWIKSARSFTNNAIAKVERIVGTLLKKKTPLSANDHPETDKTDKLPPTGRQVYQSLIGLAGWASLILRFDLLLPLYILSSFNAEPRKGYLARLIHLWGYIKGFPNPEVKFDERDPIFNENWLRKNKINVPESALPFPVPDEAFESYNFPPAIFMPLHLMTFFDASWAANLITRRSITGIILYVGRTPIAAKSRYQPIVESASYRSELSALRTAMDFKLKVLRKLQSFGVPVPHRRIFNDNLAMLNNIASLNTTIGKKNADITLLRAKEIFASNAFEAYHVRSEFNQADLLASIRGGSKFASLRRTLF